MRSPSIRDPVGLGHWLAFPNLWRIRVGDYRVIYTVRDAELVVLVLRVAHRSSAYRNL